MPASPAIAPLASNHTEPVRQVIAVANQKGGVGKTTTTVNLGSALAERGRRVLCVDLDPQGHLTVNMGVQRPDDLELTVYDLLCDARVAVGDVRLRADGMGVDFLPANVELAGAELQLVTEIGREGVLREKLQPYMDEYDFVLIDCPPSLGLLCINALVAATDVIIPLQCEYFGMKGMQQLHRTIERVRAKLNPQLRIAGILPTIHKSRTLHAREVLGMVRSHYGDTVFPIQVADSIRFAECPLAGQSILQYAGESDGARAYRALAHQVLERVGAA
ncbi:MAG TPA: AAA family ATPase [Candidatus Micrarchaeia archaeon]|nr:AAA family ATPase [Candidatus Micrarchaeia archaeon]